MKTFSYVLLILGAIGADMASDQFIESASQRQNWDIAMTLLVLFGLAMVILDGPPWRRR